ncbi:MAG TPA: translation initiation factor IF-2 [Gemmataceae bacterium]|nr:translation initiation factor IF-2 [Gemmataceae bacterium]
MQEKIRVYALAKELNLESKDLIDLCRQAGIEVKNQLSSLDPHQRDAVVQLVKRGGGGVAVAAPPKPASAVIPQVMTPVPVLHPSRPLRREPEPTKVPPAAAKAPPAPAKPAEPPAEVATEESAPAPMAPAAVAAEPKPAKPAETLPPQTTETPPPRPPEAGGRAAETISRVPPSVGTTRMRDLSQPRSDAPAKPRGARPVPRTPAVVRVAKLPTLKQRTGKEEKKAEEPAAQKPLMKLTPEMLREGRAVKPEDLIGKSNLVEPVAPPGEIEEEEGDAGKGGKVRPGQVTGRDKRHQQRNERAKLRRDRQEVDLKGGRSALLTADDDRPKHVKQRLHKIKRQQGPTQPRKGKVPVEIPITVRALSEAIGMKTGELLLRLQSQGLTTVNINSTLEPAVAETIALDAGCELDIKRPADAEDRVLAELQKPDNPEDLVLRAPIVTIMGHVDHGKTTLLDKIRESNVAATEAGGITQVIRAWRVEHNGRPITFLDTPGHEAFTKMRARGAQVTDIAVIVVAADDGVMPQTEEAINHAKAAGVPIVVAINKVDVPNANVNRTRQQLYGLELLPDNMGGDIPFVETSATKGEGIDLLLENLSILAEIKELKANAKKPAVGTCLEAMLSEGEGVLATLLVREGTLHRGDVILCGASYGRVRAMYDDLGRPIDEAGPSVPTRITGLDAVPNADDPFIVIPDLAQAREIAEKRKAKQLEASLFKREPVRLEELSKAQIAELKVILKADFRGSIEAIRKELEKLQHEEVRVRVLHTAIGGITESDVQLALTSPEDTIIVGFNVVPDDRARALAEEKGIQIREYNIIYNLTDDIKAALEGKLKPREQVVHLGRAVVRETFKISRVGTIAGCFVTTGVIERSAKIQVIRDGVVIYPPPDRTASLDSLKRFKDDVREVREGFECGLKIAGYDDIKVGDLIQAYRVEQVQRTL